MPLESGSSNDVIRANIAELVSAGRPPNQAIAIAYHEARKASGIDAANRPKSPVAFTVYTAGDRILWLKRPDGSWSFPGGSVEPGECAMEGAIRESQEEVQHTPQTGLVRVHDDGYVTIFHCDDGEFPPVLNAEHDGFVWATLDDAPEPLFPVGEPAAPTSVAMDERVIDTNGWFERRNNPLSKVGVFLYRGRNLPDAPDPDAMYRVYRPAEELSHPECINSFKLLPWTDAHPSALLGSEEEGLIPAEQKGVQGVTGENIYFDPDGFDYGALFGNIKVFSEAMLNEIDSGKTELSPGYRCRYDWTPGVFEGQPYDLVQRDIRGNHLALVDHGRMGPEVAVLDHDDINSDPKETQMSDENKEGNEGGSSVKEMTLTEVTAALAEIMPLVNKLKGLLDAKEAPAPAADTDTEKKDGDSDKPAAMDSDKEDDKADKGKDGSGMDAAEIVRNVEKSIAAKRALYDRVSNVVGAFDHADMSIDQIASYGLKQLEVDVPKGANAVQFLDAYLLGKGAQPNSYAMDSAPSKGNFIDRHIEGGK